MSYYTSFSHQKTEVKFDFGFCRFHFLSKFHFFKQQNYNSVWYNESELTFHAQEESRQSASEATKEVAMEKLNCKASII